MGPRGRGSGDGANGLKGTPAGRRSRGGAGRVPADLPAMSNEKRPRIATLAVAAAAILCLFVYTSSPQRTATEPEADAEPQASVPPAPTGGRIEIDFGPGGLVRVAPRAEDVDREDEGPEAAPETPAPDPIDAAAAKESEDRAIRTLRVIALAQEQLRESRSIDTNGDGIGEFGYLGELTGSSPLRSAPDGSFVDVSELNAFLPEEFASIVSTSAGGACEVNGYLFSVYLPATPRHSGEVEGLPEALHGGSGQAMPDANQSATRWCAYAWPSTETSPPRRALFLDAGGNALSTPNHPDAPAAYIGAARAPRWDAAFQRGDMSGPVGGETADGNTWTR